MENKNLKKQQEDRTILGFWIYLMTDLLMFAALFATYAVLNSSTFGGITIDKMVNLPNVLIETLILLTSSLTCGLGAFYARSGDKKKTIIAFAATFLLGLSFLVMELMEFSHLISEGHTFQKSAFLSSFYALVGTHGLHIFGGLFWIAILFIQIYRRGLTEGNVRKLTLFSLFWHFLDIVWIFIFTMVYLMGAL